MKLVLAVMLLIAVSSSPSRGAKAAALWPDPLLGYCGNSDSKGALKRVLIKNTNGVVSVDVVFAGTPMYSSGPQPATLYSDEVSSPKAVAFRAQYKEVTGSSTVVGRLRNGVLKVEVLNEFSDGSGRYNYQLSAKMIK